MIGTLLSPEVQKFIKDHQNDDPFLLSLNTKRQSDFPLKEAIEQIRSLRKAKKKLPSWIEQKDLIWPPSTSVEQASSEPTAEFKSRLVHGKSLVDLTGGMGVDASWFAKKFEKVSYVESDEHLSELARHNFNVIGKNNIEVLHQSSEDFLGQSKGQIDAIYIDPSRRNDGRKVFKINECAPNLYEIIPHCLRLSQQVLVKLSPMVDLNILIKDFQPSDIWVVSIKNEVKEVLFLMSINKGPATIHAIDLDYSGAYSEFCFEQGMESSAESEFSYPLTYLYEPNAAILKTGAFKLVGQRNRLKKLHQHSHLYTSTDLAEAFPGKILLVKGMLKNNKKNLEKQFPNGKVNVISRNYPLSANQLKRQFSLTDGGENYLIGTTLSDNKKVLIICERL